ncbi:hypothetical protein ACGXZQ_004181 [Escherichia albertii]
MGKMQELLFEMQEERADKWIEGNYPDAEEGTPEWDAAAQEYSNSLVTLTTSLL